MKVSIAGDFSPRHRMPALFDAGKFEQAFGDIKFAFDNSDFNIANFETTIPASGAKAIEKVGPNLSCGQSSIEALKWLGIDTLTLANNHAGDYGPESLLHTIGLLNKSEIAHVGAGCNIDEADEILYLNKDGETLAVVNCCEHEYGIATKDTAGTNPLDAVRQFRTIREARSRADYVLVIVHGGAEGFQLPTPRMQDIYRFFIDAGADAVVNHHQHCCSGIEIYDGKPIFYGLGNFAFDHPNPSKEWTEGIIATLEFTKDGTSHAYTPYIQFAEKPSVSPVANAKEFNLKIKELSDIIADRERLEQHVDNYFSDWQSIVRGRLQPYHGRILKSLYSRGFLPSLLSRENKRVIQNMVNCETHRERLQFFLNKD